MTTNTAPTNRRATKPLLLTLGSVAAAAVLGVAIAGGQRARSHEVATGRSMSTTAVPERLGSGSPTGSSQPRDVTTLILVGSQDAASAVYSSMAVANSVRDGAGELPPPVVAVVTSAEHEARLLRTIASADATNAELGLPALIVIDLRA